MIDNSIFEELSKVNGYMGGVLSDYTGEVLVSDNQKVKKLDETSMRFNENFRSIHEITDSLGLGHTRTLDIEAEHATVIMACSGLDSRVHLHAFAILSKEGSVALAKMSLKNIIDNTVKQLS